MAEITVRSDLNAIVFKMEAAVGQAVAEGDTLMLLGTDHTRLTAHPDEIVALSLDWRALQPGGWDVVVLDCTSAAAAVAELAPPILGYKRGRMTFERRAVSINWP